jgi:type 2 lantibiotic biosynthesis protein LanM
MVIPTVKRPLLQMLELAASREDRLSGQYGSDVEVRLAFRDKLAQWQETVVPGDTEGFRRRLAWDDLQDEALARLLGTVTYTDAVLPTWVEIFQAAYGDAPDAMKVHFEQAIVPIFMHVPNEPLPFDELLFPLIAVARKRLHQQVDSSWIGAPAMAAMEHSLLVRLARLTSRTFYGEFTAYRTIQRQMTSSLPWLSKVVSNSTLIYQSFITMMKQGGLFKLFQQYSVLSRLCATVVEVWVEAMAEFLDHLKADLPDLQASFGGGRPLGSILSVKTGLSDPHQRGRSVIIVHFESGTRVVYKPRNLGLEVFFGKLIAWINRRTPLLPLEAPACLERDSYGWIAFVDHRPCESEEAVQRYYTRTGMLLALVYVLKGTDFHYENLIACGEHPLLIDMEALLTHRFELRTSAHQPVSAGELARQVFESTVLQVALLPALKETNDGRRVLEMGGLSADTLDDELQTITYFTQINTDDMQLVRQPRRSEERLNLPQYHNQVVEAFEYVEAIVAGFDHLYGLLMQSREALLENLIPCLKGQEVRFIFRNTSLYFALLERSLLPKYLRTGTDRFIQLDVLCRALLSSEDYLPIWPIVREEQQQLERMDIPFFTARSDSTALVLPSGAILDNCFTATAYEEVVQRLNHLSETDRMWQCELIRATLYASKARDLYATSTSTEEDTRLRPVAITNTDFEEQVLLEASAVAQWLYTQIRQTTQEAGCRIGIQYHPKSRRYSVGAGNYSLFDGACGTAFFLAALAHVSEIPAYKAQALEEIRLLREQLLDVARYRSYVDIGGATGIGSAVYALTRMATFLKMPNLLQDARQLASLIIPEKIARDDSYDVVSGSAGAILGLLALYRATEDAGILQIAQNCGDHLLRHRVVDEETGELVWRVPGRLTETGFAHGVSGIALALLRLGVATGEVAYRDAAWGQFIFLEKKLGTRLEGADLHNTGAAWSHGATGIGMAVLNGLFELHHPLLQSQVEAALYWNTAHLLEGVDNLCCGSMGRMDLLVQAAQGLNRPALLQQARKAAQAMMNRARQQGSYRLGWGESHYHFGFGQGMSGIAYGLLRLAQPQKIPSVLVWN